VWAGVSGMHVTYDFWLVDYVAGGLWLPWGLCVLAGLQRVVSGGNIM
jgi:hypothetical protein